MSANSEDATTKQSRRDFLKTTAAASAGLAMAGPALAQGKVEKLALDGGPKTVNYPARKFTALTRWPRFGAEEKKRIGQMIDGAASASSFYAELPLFEKEWQGYTKSPFVKSHINGTSALTSMYFALNLPPGSEIMVPSYTFFATCLAMRFFGHVPIFIDIDPKTACFDLEDAKRKLTPRTKAVVAMHSWGLPCEMDRIAEWAKEKGLILLEDSAHAHGASMQGKKMGTWGLMGIYSFQGSKVLPAIEGGMGMYQEREHFERAAAFGHYEVKFPEASPVHPYEGTGFGQKYRMHPFSAALGREQLKKLDDLNALVSKNVRALNDRLVQLPGIAEPRCRPDQQRVYYNGNMLMMDFKALGFSRDALVKALKAEGVQASFWDYPEQHKLKIYSEPQWWHHPPQVPDAMPGNAHVNANHIFLPLFYEAVPELNEQYARAFEKVWAHRERLKSA